MMTRNEMVEMLQASTCQVDFTKKEKKLKKKVVLAQRYPAVETILIASLLEMFLSVARGSKVLRLRLAAQVKTQKS